MGWAEIHLEENNGEFSTWKISFTKESYNDAESGGVKILPYTVNLVLEPEVYGWGKLLLN